MISIQENNNEDGDVSKRLTESSKESSTKNPISGNNRIIATTEASLPPKEPQGLMHQCLKKDQHDGAKETQILHHPEDDFDEDRKSSLEEQHQDSQSSSSSICTTPPHTNETSSLDNSNSESKSINGQHMSEQLQHVTTLPADSDELSLPETPLTGDEERSLPTPMISTDITESKQGSIGTVDAMHKGYYEGSCPMAVVPDDTLHLTENQQFIRNNLEFFSATKDHLEVTPGRGTPILRGRVGFRCVHCSRAYMSGKCPRMVSGSVSFPLNFTALYNLAIQKQLHFKNCPNIPAHLKQSESDCSRPRKRIKIGIPSMTYWHITCHRLGIVELPNNAGLRFGRDLNLDPLPFQSVRIELEQEQPQLFPRPKYNTNIERTEPPSVLSMNSMDTIVSTPAPSSIKLFKYPKAVSDVLEEAKKEQDDPLTRLISMEDATALTDFIFLTMKQATICHAAQRDFATRGKKSKVMRLGYAGFCCRHCKLNNSIGHGHQIGELAFQNYFRSFASSRDALGSVLSNSFALHLMKCVYTPYSIKHALQILKKVHSKQMRQLPHGSQSSVFLKVWERIRAADKPKEIGHDDLDISIEYQNFGAKDDKDEYIPATIGSSPPPASTGGPFSHDLFLPGKAKVSRCPLRSSTSNSSLPFSIADDDEFLNVLKDAEENWEPSQNDYLILAEDRKLVSDFVFLCMRQLKVAIPCDKDFRMNRRKRIAGLCCIHCSGTRPNTSRSTSSGRGFPSAPDNIASILNGTAYKHMMSCPDIPITLKRTISYVKKLHTQQCASLPFGSQRRFFKKVFARLQKVPLSDTLGDMACENIIQADSMHLGTLQKYEFLQVKNSDQTYWQCSKCRMVPYDYRAPGSIFFSKPRFKALQKHRMACKHDGIYWDTIQKSFQDLSYEYGDTSSLAKRETFFDMVKSIVGSEVGVADTFVSKLGNKDHLLKVPFEKRIWRQIAVDVDFENVQESFSALRKDLGLPPANLHDSPDFLHFCQLLSCNFKIPPRTYTTDKKKESVSTLIVSDRRKEAIQLTQPQVIEIDMKNQKSTNFCHLKARLLTNASIDKQISTFENLITGGMSARCAESITSRMTTEIEDSKPKLQIDHGKIGSVSIPSATKSTNDKKEEMIWVNYSLSWEVGIMGEDVMDKIVSGQFDDA